MPSWRPLKPWWRLLKPGWRPPEAWLEASEAAGRTDGRKDVRTKSPLFYRASPPSGPLPKKGKKSDVEKGGGGKGSERQGR